MMNTPNVETYRQTVFTHLQEITDPYLCEVTVQKRGGQYIARLQVPGVSESDWEKRGATEVEALTNLYESYRTLARSAWGRTGKDLPPFRV